MVFSMICWATKSTAQQIITSSSKLLLEIGFATTNIVVQNKIEEAEISNNNKLKLKCTTNGVLSAAKLISQYYLG